MSHYEAMAPEELAEFAGALASVYSQILTRRGSFADYEISAGLCEDGRTVMLMADLSPDDSDPILALFTLAGKLSQDEFDRLGIDAALDKNWEQAAGLS